MSYSSKGYCLALLKGAKQSMDAQLPACRIAWKLHVRDYTVVDW